MKAVILAAGKGSHFVPFDYYWPKTLWPVCDKPLLGHLFERLLAVGIDDVVLVVHHRKERVRAWLALNRPQGLKVEVVEQPAPRGTADALSCALEVTGDSDVLVIYGDLAFGPGVLPQVLEAFRDTCSGVVAVAEVDKAASYLRVEVESGLALDYEYKDAEAGKGTVLAGLFALTAETADLARHVSGLTLKVPVGVSPDEESDLAELITLAAARSQPLKACVLEDWWVDVNFAWDLFKAYERIFAEKIAALEEQVVVSPGAVLEESVQYTGPIFLGEGTKVEAPARLEGPVWLEPGAKVEFGTVVHPGTWVGKGSILGPNAEVRGMVDEDVQIRHCAEFEGIALHGSRFVHGMELAGIYGAKSEIGAGTRVGTLRFDNGPTKVLVKGRFYEAEGLSGVLYGDYSRTGVGALLMPGRTVGPCGLVGAGVVLEKNVPPFTLVRVKQELVQQPWPHDVYDL